MCGFAGYLNVPQSNNHIDQELLEKMQQSIAHRGPDGHGTWMSEIHQLGMAHRRLSIVDLSAAGAQPMLDKQKSVVICFNGEIYNHEAIRKELIARGYTYFSQTDTETLIYAYKEWGIDFIHKLEGMFAFALFDLIKNELYLVRDRIGIKPLYFSTQGQAVSFASEIKALWQLPWNTKRVNEAALYHYLTFMATPAPMTLYKGVYKLPAGHYAKIDSKRQMSFKQWYHPYMNIDPAQQYRFQDEQYCVESVRDLLRASVKKRMMSDVPVGVFLSGGVDSSLNVALMSEISDKVKTFNVVFSDFPENDERKWARKVSDHFGTEHHEIAITEKDAAAFFDPMVHYQDEPLADCVCVPLYHVAKLAKDSGVTVVQVGEGSDELFCGYSLYARNLDIYRKYWRPSQKLIPRFAKKLMHKAAALAFPTKIGHLDTLKNWAEGRNMFWGGAIAFPEFTKEAFFAPDVLEHDPIVSQIYEGMNQSFDSYDIVAYHLEQFKKLYPNGSFLDSMIYLELKQRLPELLLMRVDKMAMATSIEGRVPFLDHELVEFALQIPPRLKYKGGQTKYILKKACEGILPHDVIYRKKVGFAAPTSRWYRTGSLFNERFMAQLDDQNGIAQQLFNTQPLKDYYYKHRDNKGEYAVQLWVIQNLVRALEQ